MYRKRAFTMVELIVVLLILGILAAIAAPKLLATSSKATDNGLRQTLYVVRDAIDMYRMTNEGKYPGSDGNQDTFKADLMPFIRGDFPICPVGPAQNDLVRMVSGTALSAVSANEATRGWKYNYETGRFAVNWHHATASDPSVYYDEL